MFVINTACNLLKSLYVCVCVYTSSDQINNICFSFVHTQHTTLEQLSRRLINFFVFEIQAQCKQQQIKIKTPQQENNKNKN